MNLKILRWVVTHRELLMKVVQEVQAFDRGSPYIDQWTVVDRVARLVIPVLEAEKVDLQAFFDYSPLSLEEGDVQLLAAGAEVQALGIDWKTLAEVILPIIVTIIELLMKK